MKSLIQITICSRSPRATSLPVAGSDIRVRRDYSEEAIPERDPAYRLPCGTDPFDQTVEVVPAAVRQDLAHRLQLLGVMPARAALLASL